MKNQSPSQPKHLNQDEFHPPRIQDNENLRMAPHPDWIVSFGNGCSRNLIDGISNAEQIAEKIGYCECDRRRGESESDLSYPSTQNRTPSENDNQRNNGIIAPTVGGLISGFLSRNSRLITRAAMIFTILWSGPVARFGRRRNSL